MKKIIALFLVLFISSIYTVSSLKTFEIDETEKLSLGLEADDPDADKLIYTFTEPLDANGEWQTDYGDAGEYKSRITVSDGVNEVSEDVIIIVNRKEAEPVIDDFEPRESSISIDESGSVEFKVDVSDANNDELTYEWMLNGEVVSDVNELIFTTGYEDSGEYKINVVISDGVTDLNKEWIVNVNDVDLDNILNQIEDISVMEGDTVSLNLPDFDGYGLTYSISGPLGDKNKWKTDLDDSGVYTVIIAAEGVGFKGQKEVQVTVNNKDRPPKFVGLKNVGVNENEQVRIEIITADPDEDNVILSVENIPQNARLDGNIFTWTPSYDFVQKNNAFDYILDRFRLLRKSINIVFIAQSNELSVEKNVKITVKESNRPFVLESIEDIEVDEGQEILIDPKYDDPDNDRVSFSYSGFMNSNKKKVGFDDSGEYVGKVVPTDGFHTETKFVDVKVNDVNRKPKLNVVNNIQVKEGDEVKIELSATDPDNDAVSFLARNLPKGAKLKDNLFIWKPGFEVVDGTEKEFSVDFFAFDGEDEVSKKIKITVLDVNQAPEIISSSDNLVAVRGETTLFEVNAEDGDGDELTYSWRFGYFDKYEDGNQHQRIFSTTGKKKVEVTVSDGIETVTKVWNVEVV